MFKLAHNIPLLFLAFLFIVLAGCEQQEADLVTPVTRDSVVTDRQQELWAKKEIDRFRRRKLPRDFEVKIKDYSGVIRKYSKRYGFDWRLIVSQILKESRFKEQARSHVGAQGLMQIMPSTAREIRREMDIEYIGTNPRENIAAGIYHLYKQMKYFRDSEKNERLWLALAAYNCGAGRIFDAQDIARELRNDPNKWPGVKDALPKLDKTHWKLHLDVWELGTPKYGYFFGYRETIDYVDDIQKTYSYIKAMY